jgi:asparagine N-glycosylation enzyme membrane subunit Stt3
MRLKIIIIINILTLSFLTYLTRKPDHAEIRALVFPTLAAATAFPYPDRF